MVPSDPISSPLTTGMHGIELRDQERRTLRLSAPLRTFFAVRRINAFKHAACCLSLGTGSLVTAFRSPTTAATSRRPPFRGQSSLPATSHPSRPISVPVRPFDSATALRFAPVTAASTSQARCTSTIRFGLPRPPPPLPSGIVTSLGIKAFSGVCCLPVRLANSPDFPSLPDALPFYSVASDQRSRSATFPPACCSSNLLEPHSLCSRLPFRSIDICASLHVFPQYL
jgi:hypothetical protein